MVGYYRLASIEKDIGERDRKLDGQRRLEEAERVVLRIVEGIVAAREKRVAR